MKAMLDEADIVEQDSAPRQAAGQAFYNTSRLRLRDRKSRADRQQLKADFETYLGGFSPNVQDILDNFELRSQIPRLSMADALGTLVEKLTSPDVNLSPTPLLNEDGSINCDPGYANVAETTMRAIRSRAPPRAARRHDRQTALQPPTRQMSARMESSSPARSYSPRPL